jgi:transitional endoplasmic reticulum ATPase
MKVPCVHWEDIGGMDGVKRSLKEVIEMPQKFPHLFESLGIYVHI